MSDNANTGGNIKSIASDLTKYCGNDSNPTQHKGERVATQFRSSFYPLYQKYTTKYLQYLLFFQHTSYQSKIQNTNPWIFAYLIWPRDPNHCDWLSGLPCERIVLGDWWAGSRAGMFSKVYRLIMLIKSGQTGLEPVRKQRYFLAVSAAWL